MELLPGGILPNYARGASKKSPLGVVGVGMSPNHATYMYISTHLKQFPHKKNIKILYQKHLKKWLKYVLRNLSILLRVISVTNNCGKTSAIPGLNDFFRDEHLVTGSDPGWGKIFGRSTVAGRKR